jgi:enediyne biosynthesis protein E4
MRPLRLVRRITDSSLLAVAGVLVLDAALLGAAKPPSPIRFELKKIPFRLENSETPARNAPETMPGGVAIFDYNGDGRPDIFFTNGANIATLKKDSPKYRNRLFRNDGNGVFTDVTTAAGLDGTGYDMGVAAGDYDNDGYVDLYVTGVNHNQLFHNNGDGTFTEVTHSDGLPNLLGKGMGIAVTGFSPHHPSLLFVANDNARNLLLRGTGHGFEEIGVEAGVAYNGDGRNISGMGADFGDIDGDGLPDLVMTGLKNETYEVFLNRSDGIFVDGSAPTGLLGLSRPWSGWGCGLIDLDNDGWLDLFVAGGGLDTTEGQPNQIFHNTRGKFFNVSESVGQDFGVPALHRGAVFADFDRDGRIDAVVTSLNAPIELWWNRTPKRNWLQFRLQGSRSNRSAIGAQVTCKTSKGSQSRTVTNCVGYASSSDLTVHFGLDAEIKASVKIEWPSGTVQELGEVTANQQLKVQEPTRT